MTSYLSWQHGAKAGISQISGVDANGIPISRPVAPESSNAYELGLKGSYLHDTLTANADIYVDFLDNFQQTVYILDPVLTQQIGTPQYTSITGNAPLVQARGFELDAAYTGIKHLTLRFAGDYSHAFYDSDILLPKPVENGDQAIPFYDAKGQTLANAPKFSGNLSGEYSLPVLSTRGCFTPTSTITTSAGATMTRPILSTPGSRAMGSRISASDLGARTGNSTPISS